MKKISILMITVVCVLITAMAFAQDDIKQYSSCKYCGMNRQQFAHSRVLIEYDDASAVGTCSIHCAAVDLAINIDKTPKTIQVGDYNSKALIDAEKASWVIGGSKVGVMTKGRSGLLTKRKMLKSYQGKWWRDATFDVAMKAAYEDMYEDTKMIREKKKNDEMQHKK